MVNRLRCAVVCAALYCDLEAPLAAQVDRLLVEAGVPAQRQAQAPPLDRGTADADA
jgi:hypothetical protein